MKLNPPGLMFDNNCQLVEMTPENLLKSKAFMESWNNAYKKVIERKTKEASDE